MIKWIENRRRKAYKKWLRKSRGKRNIDGVNQYLDQVFDKAQEVKEV